MYESSDGDDHDHRNVEPEQPADNLPEDESEGEAGAEAGSRGSSSYPCRLNKVERRTLRLEKQLDKVLIQLAKQNTAFTRLEQQYEALAHRRPLNEANTSSSETPSSRRTGRLPVSFQRHLLC